jgi:hypothetical protein
MALTSAQTLMRVSPGLDRLMRGVFAGAGLLALGLLAWRHLGLGALLFRLPFAPKWR